MNQKDEIKENTLIIPIAVSGTGKTTLGEMLQKKYEDMVIVSLDDIREEISEGGKLSRNDVIKAYVTFFNRISEAMHNGNRVYADATNLQSEIRKKLYSIAMNKKSPIKVLFFNVDKETSKKENSSRDIQLTEEAIEKQYKDLKKARKWIRFEVPKEDIIDIISPEKDVELEL